MGSSQRWLPVLPLVYGVGTYVASATAGFSLFYNAFGRGTTNQASVESAYWVVFAVHLVLPVVAFGLAARQLKLSVLPGVVVLVLIMLFGTMFTLVATTIANSCVYKMDGVPLPTRGSC